MVKTIHKCEECGRRDFSSLKDAKKHEDMLVKELPEGLIYEVFEERGTAMGKSPRSYEIIEKRVGVDEEDHSVIYRTLTILSEIKDTYFVYNGDSATCSSSLEEQLSKSKIQLLTRNEALELLNTQWVSQGLTNRGVRELVLTLDGSETIDVLEKIGEVVK